MGDSSEQTWVNVNRRDFLRLRPTKLDRLDGIIDDECADEETIAAPTALLIRELKLSLMLLNFLVKDPFRSVDADGGGSTILLADSWLATTLIATSHGSSSSFMFRHVTLA